MNIEDKIFFEQRFKGIGISEEELLLYLNCLRHSREISNSSDILMCRFDKKIEINFSLGYDDNGSSKTIGGFISKDDNSVLFDCEKYDYDTNKSIKYIEEFIFENSSIKRITSYSDEEKYVSELPLFTQEDMQEFIDTKVSQIKGNILKK